MARGSIRGLKEFAQHRELLIKNGEFVQAWMEALVMRSLC